MDWEMFFDGLGMVAFAFFLRVMSVWVYGKDGEEKSFYNSTKKIGSSVEAILLILGGLFVIFISLTTKK